ncbi:endo alpha-1,4 polygalactosaminidase [Streptomyces sp. Je 1-369]|uniref:endo alpha-1,4 polygalactosaminidase n=1 Tax=Streptomyces sp. Je 1-369 TaxID=2966192 RepID=UPI00228648C1|nr:endo alpha-1,4 polygalactosaminidase [Streptomyces sp. Je 1-369]WAL93410.1 endo alpha-1,4 polygalactosaminidase [Streptomyces sp. Je 1-369]
MNGTKWRTSKNRILRAGTGGTLLLALLVGCSTAGSGTSAGSGKDDVRQPPVNATFDYQLGGPYKPPSKVRAVSRDRTADPAPDLYNICYVNAFQAQPGKKAARWWEREHGDLVLRDKKGRTVVDEDWQEPLLDISTPKKREALAEIVGEWIDGCAEAGFDAVEPDNLDSYERSDGLLTTDDAAAFAELLARRAHDQGLAIAQKNTTDLLDRRERIGFDFAVTEECAHYKECPDFTSAYDGKVFDIEYVTKDFDAACRTWGKKLSVTLRDRDVRPAGEDGYVYRHC